MATHINIHTDGGSRGNPGPGAAAYVLTDSYGNLISGRGVFIPETTNNFAEYTGMIEGLTAAKEHKAETISGYSDSQLMVRQINGKYKVKSPNLKPLHAKCMELLSSFKSWQVEHVYRESNVEADELANQAMDKKGNVDLVGQIEPELPKKPPLRLAILLSGGGTTMLNIDDEIKSGRLNAEIALVISSRSNVKGIERAKKIGIEPVIIRKKDYSDIDSFSDSIVKVLDQAKIDLVIQAGWLCLWKIPPNYDNRVMNIHPALLPSFGGQGMWGHHVHEAVLNHGCKISGCTVHFANNHYDKGPIIVQLACHVEESDSPDTLAARVFEEECAAYPEAIRLFIDNRLTVKDGTVKIS